MFPADAFTGAPSFTGGDAGPSGAFTGDQRSETGDSIFGNFTVFGSGDGARTNTQSTGAADIGTLVLYAALGFMILIGVRIWQPRKRH